MSNIDKLYREALDYDQALKNYNQRTKAEPADLQGLSFDERYERVKAADQCSGHPSGAHAVKDDGTCLHCGEQRIHPDGLPSKSRAPRLTDGWGPVGPQ